MTTSRPCPGAPLAEAIIDLHVESSESATLSDLERCCAAQAASFPSKKVVHLANGQMTLGSEFAPSARTQQVGFLCTSADQKRIFQARLDGFKLNYLAPYPGWEPFRDEARRLWDVYRDAVRPRQITRVAIRYINRLDLPSPFVELQRYLRTAPEVSSALPQAPAAFFMRLVIPQEDLKSTLLLTEATGEPPTPHVASIFLDIDLFRTVDVPPDEEGVWGLLEKLHLRQNEVFEACVTERFKELMR